ncbi:MAG: hypothetical protein AB1640_25415 [bacterium]
MKRTLVAVVLGVLLTHSGVRAADTYDLKPGFRENQSWSFEQTGEMQQTATMTAPGQPAGQPMQQRLRQTRKGTVTVLAARGGLPTSIRIQFEPSCGGTMEGGGQQQAVPFAFAGQQVTLTRDARGQVQHDAQGEPDPAAAAELAGYFPTADAYPSGPVAIGDQWSPDLASLRSANQLGPQDPAEAVCQLVSVKRTGGAQVAEIRTTIKLQKRQDAMEMQTDMTMTSHVSLDTGLIVRSDSTGTFTMRGAQQMTDYAGQPMTVQVDGRGSSRIQLAVRERTAGQAQPATAPVAPPAGRAAAPAAAPVVPSAAAGQVVRYHKVSVQDQPNGIGGEAFSFLCPAGWQTEGGMLWRDHPAMPATVHLRVFNPQGLEQLESFPTLGFSWGGLLKPELGFPAGANYMGNEVRPPVETAMQYLKEIIVPRYRGNVRARQIGEQELPEWAKAVSQQTEQTPGVQLKSHAGKIRLAYTVDGQAVEEDLYCVLQTVLLPGANNMYIQSGERVHGMRAASGRLDESTRMMQTMVTSVRANPQWFNQYQQVCQALQKMQMQKIRTAGQISRIISESNREISDMMQASWERRQESEDRISRKWSETIRGVDTYYNPVEQRPVELPSGYRHAWVSGNGDIVVTDQASFNPNVELGGNWQTMQPQE